MARDITKFIQVLGLNGDGTRHAYATVNIDQIVQITELNSFHGKDRALIELTNGEKIRTDEVYDDIFNELSDHFEIVTIDEKE